MAKTCGHNSFTRTRISYNSCTLTCEGGVSSGRKFVTVQTPRASRPGLSPFQRLEILARGLAVTHPIECRLTVLQSSL